MGKRAMNVSRMKLWEAKISMLKGQFIGIVRKELGGIQINSLQHKKLIQNNFFWG